MTNRPEAQDPAEVLKRHYTTLQVTDDGSEPRYVMSDRNRARLERIEQKVRQLRRK